MGCSPERQIRSKRNGNEAALSEDVDIVAPGRPRVRGVIPVPVVVSGGQEHPCFTQLGECVTQECCCVRRDVVVFEQITTTKEGVGVLLLGQSNDVLEHLSEGVPAFPRCPARRSRPSEAGVEV